MQEPGEPGVLPAALTGGQEEEISGDSVHADAPHDSPCDVEEPGHVSSDGRDEGDHRSAPLGHGGLVCRLSQARVSDCAAGVPFHPVPSSTHT